MSNKILPSLTCTIQTNAQLAIVHFDDLPLCITHNTTDVQLLKNFHIHTVHLDNYQRFFTN